MIAGLQDAGLFTHQRTLDIRFAPEEVSRTYSEQKLRGAAFVGEKNLLPSASKVNGHANGHANSLANGHANGQSKVLSNGV